MTYRKIHDVSENPLIQQMNRVLWSLWLINLGLILNTFPGFSYVINGYYYMHMQREKCNHTDTHVFAHAYKQMTSYYYYYQFI